MGNLARSPFYPSCLPRKQKQEIPDFRSLAKFTVSWYTSGMATIRHSKPIQWVEKYCRKCDLPFWRDRFAPLDTCDQCRGFQNPGGVATEGLGPYELDTIVCGDWGLC